MQLKTFSKLVKLPVQAAALQRRFGRTGRCAVRFDDDVSDSISLSQAVQVAVRVYACVFCCEGMFCVCACPKKGGVLGRWWHYSEEGILCFNHDIFSYSEGGILCFDHDIF